VARGHDQFVDARVVREQRGSLLLDGEGDPGLGTGGAQRVERG